MHHDSLVCHRQPSQLAVSAVRASRGIARSVPVSQRTRQTQLEMQPGGDVRVNVGSQVVALVGEVVDVTVLPVVAERGVVAGLVASSGHGHVVLLRESGAEHLVDVVHVVPTVGRVTVGHRCDILRSKVRIVLGAVGDGSAGQLVHHVRHIIIVGELRAVHELREIGVHRHTERGVIGDGGLLLRSPLGRDDHHAARAFQSVHSGRRSVLEDRDALDVIRIDVVDVTHRKSVHNVGDSVDRAAQTQGSLILARLSGLLHGGDTRKTAGKNLRDVRGRSLQDLVPLDRRDRSRQG